MAFSHKMWGLLMLFLIARLLMSMPDIVRAETKRAELVVLEQEKDLVVNFSFDAEIVDITFISPSDESLGPGNPRVEMISGDLWSTYRISNAEIGTWSVSYDLKKNSGIQYSVIEEDYGLWIQYFTLSSIHDNYITVSFEADCEVRQMDYEYEIYAVGIPNDGLVEMISSGRAMSGKAVETEISLLSISTGTYQLRLEISCRDGEAELFDAMLSDSFDFTNPNEPGPMEGYCVYIDRGNLLCDVVWEDYEVSCDEYKVGVSSDGEKIYDEVLGNDVTSSRVIFPESTKKLEVSLAYRVGGIWSSSLIKQIDLLDGEYLRLGTGETTNSSQFRLEYSVKKERILSLSVNGGDEGKFRLMDEGYLSLGLEQGNNTVYAVFESEDMILYRVDTEIYFDAYPPEIILYENLDGKTFHNDEIEVIGRVAGGNSLTANNNDVELDGTGGFSVLIELAVGENILSLTASDVNGNSATQVLTLYRSFAAAGILDTVDHWRDFLPLSVSLAVSATVAVFALFFVRKRNKKMEDGHKSRKKSMVGWIILCIFFLIGEVLCIYGSIVHFVEARSLDFLKMAEHSSSYAVRYLRIRDTLVLASLVGFFVCGGVLLTTILVAERRKNK